MNTDTNEKVLKKKMVNCDELYQNLWAAYKKAFPDESKASLQKKCNSEWNELKIKSENANYLERDVQSKIQLLLQKATVNKSMNLLKFLKPSTASRPCEPSTSTSSQPNSVLCAKVSESLADDKADVDIQAKNAQTSEIDSDPRSDPSQTPSQDQSKIRIDTLRTQISNLVGVRDIGFASKETEQKISKLKKDLVAEENSLKRKINDAIRKRKSRKVRNTKLKKMCEKYPDIKKDLKFRDGTIGRPRLEVDQPELLTAIIDIAAHGGAADPRRRTECKSLEKISPNKIFYPLLFNTKLILCICFGLIQ